MSLYVNFYLKKDDTWAMLADFSRSTAHYEVIENMVPFGKLVPLTAELMKEVFANIEEELEHLKEGKERNLKEIEIIADMPNSVEEKLEAIYNCRNSVEWYEEEIENMKAVQSFYSVISEIRYTGEWLYKAEDYVWAGIEAGPPGEDEEA